VSGTVASLSTTVMNLASAQSKVLCMEFATPEPEVLNAVVVPCCMSLAAEADKLEKPKVSKKAKQKARQAAKTAEHVTGRPQFVKEVGEELLPEELPAAAPGVHAPVHSWSTRVACLPCLWPAAAAAAATSHAGLYAAEHLQPWLGVRTASVADDLECLQSLSGAAGVMDDVSDDEALSMDEAVFDTMLGPAVPVFTVVHDAAARVSQSSASFATGCRDSCWPSVWMPEHVLVVKRLVSDFVLGPEAEAALLLVDPSMLVEMLADLRRNLQDQPDQRIRTVQVLQLVDILRNGWAPMDDRLTGGATRDVMHVTECALDFEDNSEHTGAAASASASRQ
jgi:hypothetical protein